MTDHYLREVLHQEWILTNGLGGYALGFGNFINERKYNGLLVASDKNFQRTHIFSSIEEIVDIRGNTFHLDANHYPDCIYPKGYEHIVKSWLRPIPAVLYSSFPHSENILILKQIFICPLSNAVSVRYSNLGTDTFTLIFRPKLTLRDHHELNSPGTWDQVKTEHETINNSFFIHRLDNLHQAQIYFFEGTIEENPIIFRRVFYPLEAHRGYDAVEDLLAPIAIYADLAVNQSYSFMVSSTPLKSPGQILKKAIDGCTRFPYPRDFPLKTKNNKANMFCLWDSDIDLFCEQDFTPLIQLAADDFITQNDIIAGYPWFGTWSRDTLISLSALSCLPNKKRLIPIILKKYSRYIKNGLIPNTFGEGENGANYDTIDAPLWYCLRAWEWLKSSPKKDEKLSQSILAIFSYFLSGRSTDFHIDPEDSLINIKENDKALTWMDAKIYNTPVTPRYGKPIEINALWLNLVMILIDLCLQEKKSTLEFKKQVFPLKELQKLAEQIKKSMQKFITDDYLADRLHQGKPINEIRPNAIMAMSLPYDICDLKTMKKTWETAYNKLLTPYGLRTLSPENPAFKKKCIGNQKQRDLSYHQGTVWPFLLLPFAIVYLKVFAKQKSITSIKKDLSDFIQVFKRGFLKGDMASIGEIWDGDKPKICRGSPAQAWSVMAILYIDYLINKISSSNKNKSGQANYIAGGRKVDS